MPSVDFNACLGQTLQGKQFGIKRIDEMKTWFEYYKNVNMRDLKLGEADAAAEAAKTVLSEMQYRVNEKARITRSNMQKIGEMKDRANRSKTITTLRGNIGRKVGQFAKSLIYDDPRLGGKNVHTQEATYFGKYVALIGSTLEHFHKGAFGRQVGKADLDDIVRELYAPNSTGSKAAAEFAVAYRKTQQVMVDDFRRAGGTMRVLTDFMLPQKQSYVRLAALKAAGEIDSWIDNHINWLDWSKTVRPDGTIIPQSERRKFLTEVFRTMSSNGHNKIEPSYGAGIGASIGNQLDKHRLLFYKDADSWLAMHTAYGEGNVFDVITSHMESMAHKTALVDVFGSNPQMGVVAAKRIAQDMAEQLAHEGKAKGAYRAPVDVLAGINTFDRMATNMLNLNPMNQESALAGVVGTTSNLATAAMLKAAVLLAVGGDTVTSMAVRLANHQGLISWLGNYIKSMAPGQYGKQSLWLAQAGYAIDELVSGHVTATRFGAMQMYGPAWSRRLADGALRSSWLVRHTNAMRGAYIHDTMGMFWRYKGVAWEDVPFRELMARNGITKQEWDVVRKNVAPYEPQPGAQFLRPLDILDIKHADKHDMYGKFQGMIWNEAQRAVPSSIPEASAIMRHSTRPDTAFGALAYSFSMFKGYAVSYPMVYGRLVMSLENKGRASAVIGALVIGGLINGAIGLQLRNLAAGRTFEEMDPMDNPKFWLRAALAGGSLSVWGDFISGAVAGDPGDIGVLTAGPLAGMIADASAVFGGGVFQWAGLSDKAAEYKVDTNMRQAAEFFKRYLVPSIWQTHYVVERDVWDQLEQWLDPRGFHRAKTAAETRRKRVYGNESIQPVGQGVFTGR